MRKNDAGVGVVRAVRSGAVMQEAALLPRLLQNRLYAIPNTSTSTTTTTTATATATTTTQSNVQHTYNYCTLYITHTRAHYLTLHTHDMHYNFYFSNIILFLIF